MNPTDFTIIAIDGPAGSGKSTLAAGIARELKITWLNTGSIYRALACRVRRMSTNPEDGSAVAEIARSVKIEFIPPAPGEEKARILINGNDRTGALSDIDIGRIASIISRHPDVRKALVGLQRDIVENLRVEQSSIPDTPDTFRGVVVEGRDIGTVVFPDARVKIFLEAGIDERAQRRKADLDSSGISVEEVRREILARDESDRNRPVSPLKPAVDAIHIDNTGWTIEETLKYVLEIVRDRRGS